MSYRRILVPVDGSRTSNKALVAALEMARDGGGTVRLLHVIDELALAVGLEYPGNLLQAAREQGEHVLTDAMVIVKAAGIDGQTHLLDTPGKRLGEAVAEEAQAWRADLVVVGTHGRRGFSRVLLGSGAESVIRHATIPVLVIHGDEDGAKPSDR
jgi:nucleotide-binding universal stress UspA family protein